MRKIYSKKGESLIETLVALMIVALVLVMLAGSIVTAARVNNKTQILSTELSVSDIYPDKYTLNKVKITNNYTRDNKEVSVKVYVSKDANHYTFYKLDK